MIKSCNELTPEERASILHAIKAGRVFWPFKNASHSNVLTLQDIEAHGQIDAERGVLLLGGIEMTIQIPAPFECSLCGQRVDDGRPCGCGAR